jgi:oxaloacetate decarboxylase gamma subunit
MLEQSGVLTLLGMGIVFSFLVILIVCVSLAGKIIHAFGANKAPGQPPGASTGGAPEGSGNAAVTTAVTAAISAAVNEYQKTR